MTTFHSIHHLHTWLRTAGVDLDQWGQGSAKSVEHLWAEIEKGESRLQDDPPRRLVEAVRVLVQRGDWLLIEAYQLFDSGRTRPRGRPPSEKMKPGEDYHAAAIRCLVEELGVAHADVHLHPDSYRLKIREMNSASYPGLCTRYTFHIVQADVAGLPHNAFWTAEGANGPNDPVGRHYWEWRKT
jgi:hypothetical protein